MVFIKREVETKQEEREERQVLQAAINSDEGDKMKTYRVYINATEYITVEAKQLLYNGGFYRFINDDLYGVVAVFGYESVVGVKEVDEFEH